MIRRFPLFLMILFCVSCTKTNEEKAHATVEDYCNNTFYSPEFYQPISFDNLKIYYQPYEHTSDYLSLDGQRSRLEAKKDELYIKMYHVEMKPFYQKKVDSIDRLIDQININIETNKQDFKTVQEGWMIMHTYNKKNDAGKVVQNRTNFILSRDLSKVVQAVDQ